MIEISSLARPEYNAQFLRGRGFQPAIQLLVWETNPHSQSALATAQATGKGFQNAPCEFSFPDRRWQGGIKAMLAGLGGGRGPAVFMLGGPVSFFLSAHRPKGPFFFGEHHSAAGF